MAEMSSLKGMSYTDYMEYLLWIELGKPNKDQFLGSFENYPIIEKHIKLFIKKWGNTV